jgi:2-desacetyl-2-hydroxyethyl bacteriochlorophyllide A dehydrogenase
MPSETARAFWITGPEQGELRSEAIAAPASDEVEVETLYSAISRGTEALVYAGRVPTSEYDRMRAPFQAGNFPAPVKYGYTSVGQVADGRDDLVGRKVFCLYPHQTRYVVPTSAVTVIPDTVPAGRAVLAANLETAVNGIWDAAPMLGDRVAIVGAGTVGCLVAWLVHSHCGAVVELIDIESRKAAAAGALGVTFREPNDASRDADLVIHASGTAEGLAVALDLAGFEAKIVELSWFGAGPVAVPLGQAFHS